MSHLGHEHLEAETNDEGSSAPPPPDSVDAADVLAAKARPALGGSGLAEDDLIALAERYVRDHPDPDVDEFVTWVRARSEGSSG